jgi:hypothetical protein
MPHAKGVLPCLLATLVLSACSRQFVVTVNDQAVYDPRIAEGSVQMSDPDLQGCMNLALRQQSLEDPREMTVLSCGNANIASLEGIQQLQKLRFLDLAGNQISDLRPLTFLPQLTALSIPDNALTDISPLLDMPTLNAVILTGNDALSCAQLDRLQDKLGQNLTRPAACQR